MSDAFAKIHESSHWASRISVVLVDDSALALTALRGWLRKHLPLQIVGQAGDGQDGFELACRLQPELVITDLRMPRWDGFKLVERLHVNYPAMKLILTSSDESPAVRVAGRRCGANAFIPKSRLAEQLVDTVAHLFPEIGETVTADHLMNSPL